ncbi:MAG: DUF2437 domain-containing protein, partial [Gammaproteobacteria bacterium]|nr:DUF2437 domain-containing protein [Gammaproteobacteria bacterium]
MSKKWVRYQQGEHQGFGTLQNETIHCYSGDMYGDSRPTGKTLSLSEVSLLAPCNPTKIVAMWN